MCALERLRLSERERVNARMIKKQNVDVGMMMEVSKVERYKRKNCALEGKNELESGIRLEYL